MYESAYMFLAGSVLVVFIVILLHPGYRYVALWTALACAPAGIIGEIWLIPDYWSPPYLVPLSRHVWQFGLEDLLITGAFAGTCAAVFENMAERLGFSKIPSMSVRTFLVMEGYGFLGCIVMVLGFSILKLTAIHALFLSISLILLVMARTSVSLALVMIPFAGIIAVVYVFFMVTVVRSFFPNIIEMAWNLPNTWGVSLYGVPAEELIWAFLTAMYCGMIYRVAATKPFPVGKRFWNGTFRDFCRT